MTLQQLESQYVTVQTISGECGVSYSTVYSWLKYHRFMKFVHAFGKPVVKRADYERFKREHPELVGATAGATK